MIIVDTNAWVSFFKGEKKARHIQDMIIEDRVAMHPYIYGELLLGGLAEKARSLLLAIEPVNVIHQEAVFSFILKNRMKIRGIGWVDVNILISALSYKHRVYTFDENLTKVSREFNCNID